MPATSSRLIFIFLIDTVILLICVLGLVQNHYKAGLNPDTHISFDVQEHRMTVSQVHDVQFSQLESNDLVKSIAGFSPHSKEELEFILDGYAIDDRIEMVIGRDDDEMTIQIILPTYYTRLYLNIQLISGIMFLVLGMFVMYKGQNLLAARIWHWASMAAGTIILCTFGSLNFIHPVTGYITRFAFITAYATLPALFLYLSFIFPTIKWPRINRLLPYLFGFSALLALAQMILFLRTLLPLSLESYRQYVLIFDINRVWFASALLFGVGNLIHTYNTAREEYEKRKIRWILLGLCTGPPAFIIFWQIPQIFSYDAIIPEELIVLVMIIIPVTFSIAIIRYNIFNIDVLIRRSTIYFLIISILFLLYAGIVGLVIMLIGSFTLQSSLTISLMAAILTPLLFDRLRKAMQELINRKFFRVNYNFRAAQLRFVRLINDCTDISSLSQILVAQISELLEISFATFCRFERFTGKWILETGDDSQIPDISVDDIIEHIRKSDKRIFALDERFIEPELDNVVIDGSLPLPEPVILVVITQTQNVETNGILLIGKKKSDTRFSLDDIDMLQSIASATGIAVERINLQQSLIIRQLENNYLQELNSIKSTFVSSVSHELSTPLSAIKMFAELMLKESKLPQKERSEYLQIIQAESDRLAHYIRNVLDLSRIERGEMRYHPEKLELNQVIREALALMHFHFQQHDFKPEIELYPGEINLNADRSGLSSAIINLLFNAIKYSARNKYIRITSSIEDGCAKISVMDRGIGIAPDDQKKIFEVFYRSDDDKVQSLGGAGLGLSLVSHFVSAHKGNIKVESTPGEGSVFTMILPVKAA